MNGMDKWGVIAEERIQEAIEEGAFDDLVGKGKPLPPEQGNPHASDWKLAFRLLDNADMAPRWIELDREVRREADRLRCELRRVHRRHGDEGLCWERAVERFRKRAERLNAKVQLRNHLAPDSVRPRFPLRAERELRAVFDHTE